MTNLERANYAQPALDAYVKAHPDYRSDESNHEPHTQAIKDLVCDLGHLFARMANAPHHVYCALEMLHMAVDNYQEEVDEALIAAVGENAATSVIQAAHRPLLPGRRVGPETPKTEEG